MMYNVNRVSVAYVKAFQRFLEENKLDDWSNEQKYNLLSYSLSRLYGLESAVYTVGISEYGEDCICFLGALKRTPKHRDKITFGDRVSIVSLSQAYFVADFLIKGMKRGVTNGN